MNAGHVVRETTGAAAGVQADPHLVRDAVPSAGVQAESAIVRDAAPAAGVEHERHVEYAAEVEI